jgi:glyoxylase-like metal-dependent hydrolase (beta-lactamase superfamily II)
MCIGVKVSQGADGHPRGITMKSVRTGKFTRFVLHTLLSASTLALAEAPFVGTQASGYYRLRLGDYEITALHDGNGEISSSLMQGDAAEVKELLESSYGSESYQGTGAGFLINTGKKLILIDSGTGEAFGSPEHHLVENLEAAGYRPGQIDLILLTHLHYGHIGGIATKDGKRVFPNAEVRMAQAESDFWLSQAVAAGAPKGLQIYFQFAREAAAPYIAAHAWSPFVGTDELAPGIIPVTLPGHTPGHSGYQVTSKGKTMLFWGDIVHVEPIQMSHPEISIAYDMDQEVAIKTRKALFAALATSKTAVAGPHMPWPAIGYVRKDGKGYKWVPMIFTVHTGSVE